MVVISTRIMAARAAAMERRAKVWQLRKAGVTYRQIGEKLGVSYEQVRRDCDYVLAEYAREAKDQAESWRTTQVQRCEDLILGLWSKASKGDPNSVRAMMAVFERQANLLGMDAPKKQEITGADGGAIQVEQTIDVNVSREERQQRIIAIVEQARGRTNPAALPGGSDLATPTGSTDERMADTG